MSFSLENLKEREATKDASTRPNNGSLFDAGTNWWPLVRAAFLAALTAFFVKLASLGWMAQQSDVSLEIRFWKGIVPHLGMQIPPGEFAHIVTWSTFIMAVGATAAFALAVLSSKLPKMVVWGWFMGVFVTLETLVLELLRHLLEPPVVETAVLWRTFIPLGAGIALAVAFGLITREKREKTMLEVPVARAVFTSPEGSRTVDTRPGAGAEPVATSAPDRVPAYAAAVTAASAPAAAPAPEMPVALPAAAAEPEPSTAIALTVAEPNRIVDARPAAARSTTPDPQPDAPRPIVDARPAALAEANGNGIGHENGHENGNGSNGHAPAEPKPIVDARPAAQRESDPV